MTASLTCRRDLLIEVHVADLQQLFHSLDPTPFRERDLDPKAEEFIAGWARELDPRQAATTGVVRGLNLRRQDPTSSVAMPTLAATAVWRASALTNVSFEAIKRPANNSAEATWMASSVRTG